jgi:hypothetical protein
MRSHIGLSNFQSTPTGYDHIILTRSADGVNNSTNDSFRLEYDTSSNQIQFHYSDSSYASAGYRGIVNVSPSGITLNEWNHFAIAWSTQGGSAAIKTYWNGTSLYSASYHPSHDDPNGPFPAFLRGAILISELSSSSKK